MSSTTATGGGGAAAAAAAAASGTDQNQPIERPASDYFSLTSDEQKLFSFFSQAVKDLGLSTELRAAGGWVRDKMLGRECKDIDIALSDMLGKQFADSLAEYATKSGQGDLLGSVGVIKANPDQSKHLETATAKIFGVFVDFVNLRAEDYAADSRIPTMRLGTALEDALRRDLTINSLFYNIRTQNIEDHTRRGFEDLENRIARTPLAAIETLTDDPLRALRAVRFSSRFALTVADDLQIALRNESVHSALMSKISRERVLAELDGMLMGPDPLRALDLLIEFGLFLPVFHSSPAVPAPDGWAADVPALLQRLRKSPLMPTDSLLRRLLLVATSIYPLRPSLPLPSSSTPPPPSPFESIFSPPLLAARKPSPSPAESLLHDRLKMKKADERDVLRILHGADMVSVLVQLASFSRLDAGLILRYCGPLWLSSLALVSALPPAEIAAEEWTAKCLRLKQHVEEDLKLAGIWDLKPMLNGKDMQQLFGVSGAAVGELIETTLHGQIMNPNFSRDELVTWLKEIKAAAQ